MVDVTLLCSVGKAVVKPEWISFSGYKLILHRATRLTTKGFKSHVEAFISLLSVLVYNICTVSELAIFGSAESQLLGSAVS